MKSGLYVHQRKVKNGKELREQFASGNLGNFFLIWLSWLLIKGLHKKKNGFTIPKNILPCSLASEVRHYAAHATMKWSQAFKAY